MTGFSSDTANVMVGKDNSVLSRVRKATKGRVYDLGCVSHLANLCANALVKALPVNVDEILIDTFYFFHGRFVSHYSTHIVDKLKYKNMQLHCATFHQYFFMIMFTSAEQMHNRHTSKLMSCLEMLIISPAGTRKSKLKYFFPY